MAINQEKVRKIYDTLEPDYEVGDAETFGDWLQNDDNRRVVWDALSEKYNMNEDYDAFWARMGYGGGQEVAASDTTANTAAGMPQQQTRGQQPQPANYVEQGSQNKPSYYEQAMNAQQAQYGAAGDAAVAEAKVPMKPEDEAPDGEGWGVNSPGYQRMAMQQRASGLMQGVQQQRQWQQMGQQRSWGEQERQAEARQRFMAANQQGLEQAAGRVAAERYGEKVLGVMQSTLANVQQQMQEEAREAREAYNMEHPGQYDWLTKDMKAQLDPQTVVERTVDSLDEEALNELINERYGKDFADLDEKEQKEALNMLQEYAWQALGREYQVKDAWDYIAKSMMNNNFVARLNSALSSRKVLDAMAQERYGKSYIELAEEDRRLKDEVAVRMYGRKLEDLDERQQAMVSERAGRQYGLKSEELAGEYQRHTMSGMVQAGMGSYEQGLTGWSGAAIKGTAGALTMVADGVPFMVSGGIGGLVGKMATRSMVNSALKGVGGALARGVIASGVMNAAKTQIVNNAIASGLTFGLYDAASAGVTSYASGNFSWGDMLWAGTKGLGKGALLGTMNVGNRLLGNKLFGNMAGKAGVAGRAGTSLAGFGSEVAFFAALEQIEKNGMTWEDFDWSSVGEQAVLIGILKMKGEAGRDETWKSPKAILERWKNPMSKTLGTQLTDEDIETLVSLGYGKKSGSVENWVKSMYALKVDAQTGESKRGGLDGALMDGQVPVEIRRKLLYGYGVVTPETVAWSVSDPVESTNDAGNKTWTVTSYTENSKPIAMRTFGSKREAEAWAENIKNGQMKNHVSMLEQTAGARDKMTMEVLYELSKETGRPLKQLIKAYNLVQNGKGTAADRALVKEAVSRVNILVEEQRKAIVDEARKEVSWDTSLEETLDKEPEQWTKEERQKVEDYRNALRKVNDETSVDPRVLMMNRITTDDGKIVQGMDAGGNAIYVSKGMAWKENGELDMEGMKSNAFGGAVLVYDKDGTNPQWISAGEVRYWNVNTDVDSVRSELMATYDANYGAQVGNVVTMRDRYRRADDVIVDEESQWKVMYVGEDGTVRLENTETGEERDTTAEEIHAQWMTQQAEAARAQREAMMSRPITEEGLRKRSEAPMAWSGASETEGKASETETVVGGEQPSMATQEAGTSANTLGTVTGTSATTLRTGAELQTGSLAELEDGAVAEEGAPLLFYHEKVNENGARGTYIGPDRARPGYHIVRDVRGNMYNVAEEDMKLDEAVRPADGGAQPSTAVPGMAGGTIAEHNTAGTDMPRNAAGEPDPAGEGVSTERALQYLSGELGMSSQDVMDYAHGMAKRTGDEIANLRNKEPKIGNYTSPVKYQQDRTAWIAQGKAMREVENRWKAIEIEMGKQVNATLEAERAVQAERQRQEAEARAEAERKRIAELQAQNAALTRKEQRQMASQYAGQVGEPIKTKWNDAEKVEGSVDEITLADGTDISGRYYLVEAETPTPSHDPRKGYRATEGFPVGPDGTTVNDRDYEHDPAAQEQVRIKSMSYDKRAVQDPVIVSKDGVVLSGNDRTQAGQLAAQQGTDGKYVEYIKNFGGKYGFSREQVEQMQHPRVVFVPDEDLPYTTETFRRFNKDAKKTQNNTEKAVMLGKTLADESYARLTADMDRYDSMEQFYSDPEAVEETLRELQRAGIIQPNELEGYRETDEETSRVKLSGAGRDLLENLFIGKALANNPDGVRMLTKYPKMRQTFVKALPAVTENAKLSADYTLQDALTDAIRLSYEAYENGIGADKPVTDHLKQQDLFEQNEVDELRSAATVMLAQMMHSGKPTDLRKMLDIYNQEARLASAGQMDLFAEGGLTTRESTLREVMARPEFKKYNLLAEQIRQRAEKNAGATENNGEKIWKSQEKLLSLQRKKIVGEDVITWMNEVDETGKQRIESLADNYISRISRSEKPSDRNKLDPDEIRKEFEQIGYDGTNVEDYQKATNKLAQKVFDKMLAKAVAEGKTSITLMTGCGASGKGFSTRNNRKATGDLSQEGVVYDAAFNRFEKLDAAIKKAKAAGMKHVKVVAVYNDAITSFTKNNFHRGKEEGRWLGIGYYCEAFEENRDKIKDLHEQHPDVELVCIDNSGNNGGRVVSVEEAMNWNYKIDENTFVKLLNHIDNELSTGNYSADEIAAFTDGLSKAARPEMGDGPRRMAEGLAKRIRGYVGRGAQPLRLGVNEPNNNNNGTEQRAGGNGSTPQGRAAGTGIYAGEGSEANPGGDTGDAAAAERRGLQAPVQPQGGRTAEPVARGREGGISVPRVEVGNSTQGGLEQSERAKALNADQATLWDTVGKQTGINVRVTDQGNEAWDGMYDPRNKRLYISADTLEGSIVVAGRVLSGKEKANFIFGHELTHAIKQTDAGLWDSYVKAVKKAMGARWDQEFTETRKRYDEDYNAKNWELLSDAEIAEEVAADFAGREILNDEQMARILVGEAAEMAGADKVSVVKAVLNQIHEMLQQVKMLFAGGSTEYAEQVQNLEKARKLWQGMYAEAVAEKNAALEAEAGLGGGGKYSLVRDRWTISALEKQKKVKTYRAMQWLVDKDGERVVDENGHYTLLPPMAAMTDGKYVEGIKVDQDGNILPMQWEKSDERPELVLPNGKFRLYKGNGKYVDAAYNPYIHTSPTPLNDQFSEAQARPNLVTVEMEVPESELTSGYKADKAKDAVGRMEWKAGIIQGQLSGTRSVVLSRWAKPARVVPESEVAEVIVKDMFGGREITMPTNVVTPALRAEMEKLGVPFVETDNKGVLKSGENAGMYYSKVYGKTSVNTLGTEAGNPWVKLSLKRGTVDYMRDLYNVHGQASIRVRDAKSQAAELIVYKDKYDDQEITDRETGQGKPYTEFGMDEVLGYDQDRQPVTGHRYYNRMNVGMQLAMEVLKRDLETMKSHSDKRQKGELDDEIKEVEYAQQYYRRLANGDPTVQMEARPKFALKRDETGAEDIEKGQRVWHGSGAEFEEFDHSFMGTGEGSHVYGWGTYVSEVEDIARMYANIASRHGVNDDAMRGGLAAMANAWLEKYPTYADFRKEMEPLAKESIEGLKEYRKQMEQAGWTAEELAEIDHAIENQMCKYDQKTYAQLRVQNLRYGRGEGERHLYEVEIPADNGENYLDWNRTATDGQLEQLYGALTEEVREGIEDFMESIKQSKDEGEAEYFGIHDGMTGGEKVAAYMKKLGVHAKGERLYKKLLLGECGMSEKEASEALSGIGIVGMKVPTNNMRQGDHTRSNYVIFDESNAKIVNHEKFAVKRREYEGEDPLVKPVQSNNVRYRDYDGKGDVFYSNAQKAVEGIKQEKATAEQWLKMIQNGGGLKAGEDKWLGLSDWLKEKQAKGEKVTKQEILGYIKRNRIEIEEVNYSEDARNGKTWADAEFERIAETSDNEEEAFDELCRKYPKIRFEFNDVDGTVSIDKEWLENTYERYLSKYRDENRAVDQMNADYPFNITLNFITGVPVLRDSGSINEIRLGYTTKGLTNKREIALTVPGIDPYQKEDNIHFGDAGEGRAVVWVRFGDAESMRNEPSDEEQKAAYKKAKADGEEYERKLYEKYGIARDDSMESFEKFVLAMTPEENAEWNRLSQQEEEAYKQANPTKREKVLVIDEIQSKRHQDGREQGYIRKAQKDALERYARTNLELRQKYGITDYPKDVEAAYQNIMSAEDYAKWKSVRDEYLGYNPNYEQVPDAPFDKNWSELAMKRMLRYAAENGYDKVAWTKGAQQAKRYNISGVVDKVNVYTDKHPAAGDEAAAQSVNFMINGSDKQLLVNKKGIIVNNPIVGNSQLHGKSLAEVFGKEIAEEIMSKPGGNSTIELGGREIGGEGMKVFYDTMLPSFMNKYGKKWGVKVGEVELDGVEDAARTMWSVDVTPEMKESVMQGQPMFRRTNHGSGEGSQVFGRKEITETAEKTAEKLGKKVHVCRNADEITDPNVRRQVKNAEAEGRTPTRKGWFNTRTGEIEVYAPAASDVEDVKKTVLHETVGHYGLRELLSENEEDYSKAMSEMYRLTNAEQKKQVTDMMQKRGWDEATAMDEYLADIAMKEETPDWWQKAKSVMKNLLRKVGIDVELSDGDLKYMLWASREALMRSHEVTEADGTKRRVYEPRNWRQNASDWAMRWHNDVLGLRSQWEAERKISANAPGTAADGAQPSTAEGAQPSTAVREEIRNRDDEDPDDPNTPGGGGGSTPTDGRQRNLEEMLEYDARQFDREFEQMKDETDARVLAAKVREFVRGRMTPLAGKRMTMADINSLLRDVDYAVTHRTKLGLKRALDRMQTLIHQAEGLAEIENMMNALNTRTTTVDKRGMVKGVLVDETANEVLKNIKSSYQQMLTTSYDDRMSEVRREIRALKAEYGITKQDDPEAPEEFRTRLNELKDKLSVLKEEREGVLTAQVHETVESLHEMENNLREEIAAMTVDDDGDDIETNPRKLEAATQLAMALPVRMKLAELRQMMHAKQEIQKELNQTGSPAERRRLENEMDQMQRRINITSREITEELKDIIGQGRGRRAEQVKADIERQQQIVRMGCRAVRDKEVPDTMDKKNDETWWKRLQSSAGKMRDQLQAPIFSFNFMAKYIDHNNGLGDGEFYTYFMKGEHGALKANNEMSKGIRESGEILAEKTKEIFGEVTKTSKFFGRTKYDEIKEEASKVTNRKIYKLKADKSVPEEEWQEEGKRMTKGQMLYAWMTWRQEAGRTKMEADGWTKRSIAEMEEQLGQEMLDFGRWVTDEYLKELRDDKYNVTYQKVMGTSMHKANHYFPLRIDKAAIADKSEVGQDGTINLLPSASSGNLIVRTTNRLPVDLSNDAFEVLEDYVRTMERWNAMAELTKDLNTLIKSAGFRNLMEANHEGLFDRWKDACAVATGSYNTKQTDIDKFLSTLHNGFMQQAIGYGWYTAIKQTLSAPAFWAYSWNPKYWAHMGMNSTPITAYHNYMWAKENLPAFAERVAANDFGIEGINDKSFMDMVTRRFKQGGMWANKLVDACTVANGARAIYEYDSRRFKKMKNEDGTRKFTDEQAEEMAKGNAQLAFNESQQSNRNEFSAPIQKDRGIMSRAMVAFQNSNIGYRRMLVEGLEDLVRKNGNKARGFAKVATVAALNAAWYMGLNPALTWQWLTGQADDEEKDKFWDGIGLSVMLGYLANGTILGPAMTAWTSEHPEYSPIQVFDALKTVWKDGKKQYEKENYGAMTWAIVDYCLKAGGVNLEKFDGMYNGIYNMIDRRDFKADDVLSILNMARTQRREFALNDTEGKTLTEYIGDVMRADKKVEEGDRGRAWWGGDAYNKVIDDTKRKEIVKRYMTEQVPGFEELNKELLEMHKAYEEAYEARKGELPHVATGNAQRTKQVKAENEELLKQKVMNELYGNDPEKLARLKRYENTVPHRIPAEKDGKPVTGKDGKPKTEPVTYKQWHKKLNDELNELLKSYDGSEESREKVDAAADQIRELQERMMRELGGK